MTDPRTPDDGWVFDPGLAAINRDLERGFREEAEEVESIVAESELRERTFADVAKEARNRGDLVTIGIERRSFTGRLLFAGRDFLTIEAEAFQADVNLAAVAFMRVMRRGARRGGAPGSDGPGTFEMRMLERRSPTDRVELGYRTQEETVLGHIIAVGQDHIVLLSDQREEWTIPLHSIAWVIRRPRTR